MRPSRRQWLLGLGLAVTALLAWFAPAGEEEPAATARTRRTTAPVGASSAPTVPAAPVGGLALAPREVLTGDVPDLFKTLSWYVPPPPVPVAPPLPFTFMGQLVENDQPQVMLVRDERLLTVRVGDAIDRNYRLESFKDRVLTFVYLPLDTRQTLNTGSLQ
jgi:hypothetical protein